MKLPCLLFGGDKRDDNAKIFAAEKIVKYRAICMALYVSLRNSSAAVPAVQSDPRRERRQAQPRRPSAASRTTREDFQMAVGFLFLVLHKESETFLKFSFWITRNKRALLPILVAGKQNAL